MALSIKGTSIKKCVGTSHHFAFSGLQTVLDEYLGIISLLEDNDQFCEEFWI